MKTSVPAGRYAWDVKVANPLEPLGVEIVWTLETVRDYREFVVDRDELAVIPSPATYANLRRLKAGESMFFTFLWTNTAAHALRGAEPLFHALFGVKTLSGTLLGPTFRVNRGYGTR